MGENNKHINRIALAAIGIAVCAFLFISLLSFDIHDWPNHDVAGTTKVHNLCGPAGAFLAYYCNYYLGPSSLGLLAVFVVWLVLFCMHRSIKQPILRMIGVILLAAVASATSYVISHGSSESLSHGNGGVLGIALGHFLLSNMATAGAVLVLVATLIVGLLLAADELVISVLRLSFGPLVVAIRNTPAWSAGQTGGKIFGWPGHSDNIPTNNGFARSQREAAIQAVTSLQEDKLDQQELDSAAEQANDSEAESNAEVDDDSLETKDSETKDSSNDSDAHRNSVKAVSDALAQMLGKRPPPPPPTAGEQDYSNYQYPNWDMLDDPSHGYSALQEKVVRKKAKVLEKTLQEFNINATVVNWETGPVITMYELELAAGIKVAQISNLANDLARSLGAGAVRVVAPIPGKHTIGIEVPNNEKEKVRIKELLLSGGRRAGKMAMPLFLGKDASGEPLIADLTAMPHCLIAGTTGSGKSVCLNSIIISLLLTQRPDMVKLILVDPKMVELNTFRDLAHLMCPIITEVKRTEQILEWLTVKMDERYAILAEAHVRNITAYNKLEPQQIYDRFKPSNEQEKAKISLRLPYLVVIIDELADLMMTSAKEVEGHIIRLAQKSRAVGIHLVLATQRPQATVVTGLIKSNLPCRISFRVSQRMDSRIVLDQNGAETLLGQGDMLFLKPGTSDLIRAQGTFLSDNEIHSVVNYLKSTSQPSYSTELMQMNQLDTANMEKDELFDDAVNIVLETKRGSVSLLQRRLTIGYSRASRLIDQMAMAGIVGDYKGSQAREVLISPEDYAAIQRSMAHDTRDGYSDLADDDNQNEQIGAPAGDTATLANVQTDKQTKHESWDNKPYNLSQSDLLDEDSQTEQVNDVATEEEEDYETEDQDCVDKTDNDDELEDEEEDDDNNDELDEGEEDSEDQEDVEYEYEYVEVDEDEEEEEEEDEEDGEYEYEDIEEEDTAPKA